MQEFLKPQGQVSSLQHAACDSASGQSNSEMRKCPKEREVLATPCPDLLGPVCAFHILRPGFVLKVTPSSLPEDSWYDRPYRGRTAPQSVLPQYYLSCATGLTLETAQGSVVWSPARPPRRKANGGPGKVCLLAAPTPLSRVIRRVPDSVCFSLPS